MLYKQRAAAKRKHKQKKKNKQKEEIVTLLWDWVNCQSSWFTQQNRARAKKESQTVSHFTLALNPSSHSISSRKPTKLSWQQHRYRVKIDKKEFIDKTKNSSSSPFSDFFFSSFFLSFSFFLSLFFFFSFDSWLLLPKEAKAKKKERRKTFSKNATWGSSHTVMLCTSERHGGREQEKEVGGWAGGRGVTSLRPDYRKGCSCCYYSVWMVGVMTEAMRGLYVRDSGRGDDAGDVCGDAAVRT